MMMIIPSLTVYVGKLDFSCSISKRLLSGLPNYPTYLHTIATYNAHIRTPTHLPTGTPTCYHSHTCMPTRSLAGTPTISHTRTPLNLPLARPRAIILQLTHSNAHPFTRWHAHRFIRWHAHTL